MSLLRALRSLSALPSIRAGAVACIVAVLSPSSAFAQSAADKATARSLATEGIKLFRDGKYGDALDKLQRAESLYDAPVHLLYIARAQVKLDKLVDGVETYRKLVRVRLEAGAPPAFKEAIDSGRQELEELEPKVPSVRIEVDPPNLDKLELKMDGESVPAAAVGIDRPANPGTHTVQAWAPGYATGETKVDLKLGEKKPVRIKLQPGQSPPLSGEAQPAPGPGPAPGPAPVPGPQPGPDTGAMPPPGGEQKPPGKIGFFAGLRIGGAVPGGTVFSLTDPATQQNNDLAMSEVFQPGGGGEIRAGV